MAPWLRDAAGIVVKDGRCPAWRIAVDLGGALVWCAPDEIEPMEATG
jgi:hypothetical protein